MNLAEIQIADVWLALGGCPLRGKRGKAFWRGGDGYSIALEPAKGTWYDHRDGKGGGILELVEVVLQRDRRSALKWLESNCGLDPRRPLSADERRAFAQRRRATSAVAEEIAYWRSALVPELNARKIVAVEAGDDNALSQAASVCNTLENGSPCDVAREFLRHRASDPAEVERLIALGRAYDLEAERIAAEAVLLLAHAAEEGSENAV